MYRAMRRVKSAHVGSKEANAGRNRKTYLALLKAGWLRWNVFQLLEITTEGEAQYQKGQARFDRVRPQM